MRYLTRQFSVTALRRGRAVEQFLGGTEVHGERAIRWVAISPEDGQCRISLHTVRDPDDENAGDLANFWSLDPVDEAYAGEGREIGTCGDEREALLLAERLTGADPGRWVNEGVAGDEYGDHVRGRRDISEPASGNPQRTLQR
ncbi:hypothetical protein GCM10010435_72010 [Winogradskya consettensis]|uniref:Uncharacterized protein n=1 Tax=Winogradskya consettensis TaxID=113560 RepID=A0A919W1G4_9ACTN|nr:hypothetical protein [Actinoplanes consettensis]GIM83522.1 hypothetical protein Aco04nite_86910 [Actinoplanes consettensis]